MYTKLQYPILSRLLAFVIAPPYLLVVATVMSMTTDLPFSWSLFTVLVGATVIMGVLGILGVKTFQAQGPLKRFGLSSLFLLIVPISIYLTALRFMLRDLLTDDLPGLSWLVIATLSVVFMIMTTSILLCLAEAIVWFVVMLRREYTQGNGKRTA